MDRERFGQLVSEWLDEPQRADLRTQIDAAAAGDAELARYRDELARIDAFVRATRHGLSRVDWQRVHDRIAERIDAGDGGLDEQLHGLPGIERRVDWNAFRQRVSSAVDRQACRRTIRFPISRRALGVAALAAAAVLVLMVRWGYQPAQTPRGRVNVVVHAAATESRKPIVRVSVSELHVADRGGAAGTVTEGGSAPEVFFMLEPPQGTLAMAPAPQRGWQ